tara:strand:+ start:151 stop:1326 length:1176 start_codon:yes stop_codon:yes gene_type:complete
MNYQRVGIGPIRALAIKPRDDSLGHQAVEIAMGLHLARHLGTPVCFRHPDIVANRALFELECDEVLVLRGWRAAIATWLGVRADADAQAKLATARAVAVKEKRKFKPGPPNFHGLDFRERYARHQLTVRLCRQVDRRAERTAQALGIARDARIVTLHVRESGFKNAAGGESPADALRNAQIETYFPAIDFLVSRGYLVARIGDPMMTPVQRPGVVDVATSPERSDELELWLMMRASLQIACDSGPYCVSYLTNTPCLAVNVTNIVGGYPIRVRDRYILKHVYDGNRGRQLTLREMLTNDYFETRKDLDRYRVIDNTAEEITEAVQEMLEILEGRMEPVPSQLELRALIEGLQSAPDVAARRVRKGEPAAQLLGDGFPGRAFTVQHLVGDLC